MLSPCTFSIVVNNNNVVVQVRDQLCERGWKRDDDEGLYGLL